jgi:hypothetical protein
VKYWSPAGATMFPPGRMEAPPFRMAGRTPAGAAYHSAESTAETAAKASEYHQTARTYPSYRTSRDSRATCPPALCFNGNRYEEALAVLGRITVGDVRSGQVA